MKIPVVGRRHLLTNARRLSRQIAPHSVGTSFTSLWSGSAAGSRRRVTRRARQIPRTTLMLVLASLAAIACGDTDLQPARVATCQALAARCGPDADPLGVTLEPADCAAELTAVAADATCLDRIAHASCTEATASVAALCEPPCDRPGVARCAGEEIRLCSATGHELAGACTAVCGDIPGLDTGTCSPAEGGAATDLCGCGANADLPVVALPPTCEFCEDPPLALISFRFGAIAEFWPFVKPRLEFEVWESAYTRFASGYELEVRAVAGCIGFGTRSFGPIPINFPIDAVRYKRELDYFSQICAGSKYAARIRFTGRDHVPISAWSNWFETTAYL